MNAPSPDSPLARQVREFCRRRFQEPGPTVRAALPTSGLWSAVQRTGTALWLDTGDADAISELWTREFTALTTNNTLLNKEIQKGIYDELVPDAAALVRNAHPTIDDDGVVLEIAFMLNAIHGLRLVETFDADVSVELHTELAHDAEASYRYGTRFAAIHPERFIVKVPLTPEGLVTARRLSDDGVRVNFTLGFSARENHLIARLARPTFVNVFMGRINSFIADNDLGDGNNTGEKATLASQREMRRLRDAGVEVRQIGASIRSGQQVHDLCGVDVLTIPTGAATGFLSLEPAAETIVDRTGDDPEVEFVAGADPAQFEAFWTIDDGVRRATDALASGDPKSWSADSIRSTLREHGAGGIFPELDGAARAQIADDGKIPVAKVWGGRVADGDAAWDGLLTEAGLASFAADQRKLDERIRGLL